MQRGFSNMKRQEFRPKVQTAEIDDKGLRSMGVQPNRQMFTVYGLMAHV